MFQKNNIVKWERVFLILYVLSGLQVFLSLFLGTSTFFSTFYIYSLLGIILHYSFKKLKVGVNVYLAGYSILFTLFFCEVTIRYLIKYPLSYSEINGDEYIMTDLYARQSNIRFKYIEGRNDLYTLEFDSGEIRDNNCLDYKYATDTCNSLGFRGLLPRSDKKIIVVLGDSFTEGVGAPVDSSFPALLRNHILLEYPDYDVLNAGVSGNDIFFDWKMVQKLQTKYELSQLIFLMNSTDINDVAERGGNERFLDNGLLKYNSRPWWEPVYAVSFIFRLITHNVMKYDFNLLSAGECELRHQIAIEKIASLISNEINPWCEKHNVRLLIVTHPLNHEIDEDESEYSRLVHSLRNINTLKIVDCMSSFRNIENAKDLYWNIDLHFKPQGYSIISETVIDNYFKKEYEKQ